MSIGLGIFASVVLILAVYHTGFRRVFLWTAAIVAALAILSVGAYFGYQRYTSWKADREAAQSKAKAEAAQNDGIAKCMARLGTKLSVGAAPDTLPANYFDNLQACTIAPDDYNPRGTDIFDRLALSLPVGYKFDSSAKVVYDMSEYTVPPCSDRLPPGFVMDKPCMLSRIVINGFRREMCVGTISRDGDCIVEVKPGAGFGKYGTQLCPYGLPVNADRTCPSWDNVNVQEAKKKLLVYRKQKEEGQARVN